MTNYIVYYHKFRSNNKGYVGVTKHSMESRLKEHTKMGKLFHKAIKKYGVDDLESVILHSDIKDIEELKSLEMFYIGKFNTYYENGMGYNMTLGGDSMYITTKGKTFEEIYGIEGARVQKSKMSSKQKGRVFTEEHKENMRKNHSNVTKENNPNFKFSYFLTPNDVLIKGVNGLIPTIEEYNIPWTLLSNVKIKQTTSKALNWSYVIVDSFNYDDSYIIELLKEKRHNMWVDKNSPDYMFEPYKNAVTVVTPNGEKIYLYTPDEMKRWCKDNNHSFDRFSDLRRGRSDRVGNRSSLYGYQIIKEII